MCWHARGVSTLPEAADGDTSYARLEGSFTERLTSHGPVVHGVNEEPERLIWR